jgi:hypothetical protein
MTIVFFIIPVIKNTKGKTMVAPYNHFDMASFMTQINNDFKMQQENWCDIRHFQFTNGYYSEYANTHYGKVYMEQYYLLKYFPFYIEECMHAYAQFLNLYDKPTLKVLSIGVGNGVDYIALRELIHVNKLDIELEYVGVDMIDWKYRDESIDFVHTDVFGLDKSFFQDVDLIVFPKSLIELDDKRLHYISLMTMMHGSDEIHFLNTYVKRNDDVSGIDQFKIIHNNMLHAKYILEDNEVDRFYSDIDDNAKITYPIYYNSWRKALEVFCCNQCGTGEANRCSLAQYPMMYKNNMAFNVLKYTK